MVPLGAIVFRLSMVPTVDRLLGLLKLPPDSTPGIDREQELYGRLKTLRKNYE